MPLVKWASLSAFAVWENVITSKERFLVIWKYKQIRGYQGVQQSKWWKISLHTLSPGVLQAMSSHLLSDSSSSANYISQILTSRFLYFHLHIYTYILYTYMPSRWFCPLWPFLITTRKFLSPDQTFPLDSFTSSCRYCLLTSVPLCILLLCPKHPVRSG